MVTLTERVCCVLIFQQTPPPGLGDGTAPWLICSGVLYPEDIVDDSPYLFLEIPGRLTGSYSGYNVDPLYVTVRSRGNQITHMCTHGAAGFPGQAGLHRQLLGQDI